MGIQEFSSGVGGGGCGRVQAQMTVKSSNIFLVLNYFIAMGWGPTFSRGGRSNC